jgi:hypothetical protein
MALKGTWYQTGLGNCGWTNNDNEMVLAIAIDRYDDANGSNCGQYVRITNTANGKSAWGKTVDSCESCGYNDLGTRSCCVRCLRSGLPHLIRHVADAVQAPWVPLGRRPQALVALRSPRLPPARAVNGDRVVVPRAPHRSFLAALHAAPMPRPSADTRLHPLEPGAVPLIDFTHRLGTQKKKIERPVLYAPSASVSLRWPVPRSCRCIALLLSLLYLLHLCIAFMFYGPACDLLTFTFTSKLDSTFWSWMTSSSSPVHT